MVCAQDTLVEVFEDTPAVNSLVNENDERCSELITFASKTIKDGSGTLELLTNMCSDKMDGRHVAGISQALPNMAYNWFEYSTHSREGRALIRSAFSYRVL